MRLFVLAGLLAASINAAGTPWSPSAYLETFTLPPCDAGNPQVVKITIADKANLNTIINDPAKSIFCFAPSATAYYDYADASAQTGKPGDVKPVLNGTITQSGSASNYRYMILDDGLPATPENHPGKLTRAQQANIYVKFGVNNEATGTSGADYWIVSRMSHIPENVSIGTDAPFSLTGAPSGSEHNILDMLNVSGVWKGILITHGSNYNTIQRSRIGDQSAFGLKSDYVCISQIRLDGMAVNQSYVIGTKVLDNEIFRCNDGFQNVRQPETTPADYPGTIIDGNLIWIDSTLYADADGAKNPNGVRACAENGLDFKALSNEPGNPDVISNNYMWGFRRNAPACGGSNDAGNFFPVHGPSTNGIFRGNVMFDGAAGVSIATGALPGFPSNILFEQNILYNVGIWNTDQYGASSAITVSGAGKTTIRNNIIVNAKGPWLRQTQSQESTDSVIECNVIINRLGKRTDLDYVPGRVTTNYLPRGAFYLYTGAPFVYLDRNISYGTKVLQSGGDPALGFTIGTNYEMPYNVRDAQTDLTFTYDNYTPDPKVKVLKNVLPKQATLDSAGEINNGGSPHTLLCDYGQWVQPE